MKLSAVQSCQRVLSAVDGLGLQCLVDIAQCHAGSGRAQSVEALSLDGVVRNTDLHACKIIDSVDRIDSQGVSVAVLPVGSDDLKALLFQLRALLSIPVRLGQSPALIPAVEQERSEDDTEIRYAVVRVECAVCQGADVLAEHHGVDQRVLVAKLGIRIDLDCHLAAGLFLDDLLCLGPAYADRLGNAVLESNS